MSTIFQDTNKTGWRQYKTTAAKGKANKHNKTEKAVLSYMLCY